MQKNNILNNYNKETELVSSCSSMQNSFEQIDKIENKNEYYSNAKKYLSINFKDIDIKKDMIVYGTLIFFILISIVFGIFNKKFDIIISNILLAYITLLILKEDNILENVRYNHIAMWNMHSSLNMIIKSFHKNQEEIDYAKIVSNCTIGYFISLLIGFVPSVSFMSVILLVSIIYGYILSFCNQDLEIIKQSLKSIKNFSPCMLIMSFMMGATIYNSYALNLTGYIVWLLLYKFYNSIKDFNFEEV